MNGYLVFGRSLVCQFVPNDKVHPDTFMGSNTKFRKVPWASMHKKTHNKDRTAQEQEKRVKRLVQKETKKRKELEALGIMYDFKGYKGEIKPKSKHKKL